MFLCLSSFSMNAALYQHVTLQIFLNWEDSGWFWSLSLKKACDAVYLATDFWLFWGDLLLFLCKGWVTSPGKCFLWPASGDMNSRGSWASPINWMTLILDKLYLESILFQDNCCCCSEHGLCPIVLAMLHGVGCCFWSICFSHSWYVWLLRQTSHHRPPVACH